MGAVTSLRPLTWRTVVLIVLAAIGLTFLVTVAINSWRTPDDELAYWLAARRILDGQPLYDPHAASQTPYAYWYPPIVAQVLTPLSVLSRSVYSGLYTLVMLGCLWWLAGRNILIALAMCAFPPIAVEFMSRNVHLIIAVILVLGLRRWGGWFAVGAAIKLAPVLGIPYLALRGRVREAIVASAFGAVLLVVSILFGPHLWLEFLDVLAARGPGDASTLLPIPYAARLATGIALMVVAARIRPRVGEPLFVVAVTIAMPTLWLTAFSTLAAIVPLVRTPPDVAEVPATNMTR